MYTKLHAAISFFFFLLSAGRVRESCGVKLRKGVAASTLSVVNKCSQLNISLTSIDFWKIPRVWARGGAPSSNPRRFVKIYARYRDVEV